MMEVSMIKVITVCSHIEVQGLNDLVYSLEKFGWDYQVIKVDGWKGFGTKVIETYHYLKEHPEVEYFVFVDAYDVVALGTPEEFVEKLRYANYESQNLILSSEKNCWPEINLIGDYPSTDSDWKYVNSGLYFAKSKTFIEIVEQFRATYEMDDQLYMTKVFLSLIKKNKARLDNKCTFFQSYSFIADDDYTYDDNKIQNIKNQTEPVFFHGNGKTDMTKVLELLYK